VFTDAMPYSSPRSHSHWWQLRPQAPVLHPPSSPVQRSSMGHFSQLPNKSGLSGGGRRFVVSRPVAPSLFFLESHGYCRMEPAGHAVVSSILSTHVAVAVIQRTRSVGQTAPPPKGVGAGAAGSSSVVISSSPSSSLHAVRRTATLLLRMFTGMSVRRFEGDS
jgi:hypothetical protein